jgi:predicted house-cleaning noncanonical NTP pyrophosphatase (MazG superfamily)
MAQPRLVRDNVPELIKKERKNPVTRTATDDEYLNLLKRKLEEEVKEFLEVGCEEELVDIMEVMNAISEYKKWPKAELEKVRKAKAKHKGSYLNRVVLERVE